MSQSNACYLSLKIWLRSCWFGTPLWNLDGPELPKSAFSLGTTRYSNVYFFNTTHFSFMHQGVSLDDSFITEADCSFLSISKFNLYIGIGILRGQKWQKWFQFRHFLKFQVVLLENYSCEFFYQVLNWRLHTTTGILLWKISGFILYIGLNASIKIPIDNIDNFFLSKIRFFKSIVLCSFYQFCAAFTENIAVRLHLLFIHVLQNLMVDSWLMIHAFIQALNQLDFTERWRIL